MAEAAGKVSARRAGSIDLDRSARRRPLEKAEIGRAEARERDVLQRHRHRRVIGDHRVGSDLRRVRLHAGEAGELGVVEPDPGRGHHRGEGRKERAVELDRILGAPVAPLWTRGVDSQFERCLRSAVARIVPIAPPAPSVNSTRSSPLRVRKKSSTTTLPRPVSVNVFVWSDTPGCRRASPPIARTPFSA